MINLWLHFCMFQLSMLPSKELFSPGSSFWKSPCQIKASEASRCLWREGHDRGGEVAPARELRPGERSEPLPRDRGPRARWRVAPPRELRQGSGGAASGKFWGFCTSYTTHQALLVLENSFQISFLQPKSLQFSKQTCNFKNISSHFRTWYITMYFTIGIYNKINK